MEDKRKEYNKEPVYYCARCLSLRILGVEGMEGLDYCDECNSTEIKETTIDEWNKMYENKHHHSYLDNYSNNNKN